MPLTLLCCAALLGSAPCPLAALGGRGDGDGGGDGNGGGDEDGMGWGWDGIEWDGMGVG